MYAHIDVGMRLFRALIQSLFKQGPGNKSTADVGWLLLWAADLALMRLLLLTCLPVRRWTRTSECFAKFTAPVSPLFLPSWHFELLYRLLPFRCFLGVWWVLGFGVAWLCFLFSLLGCNLVGNSLFTRLR